jgi:hypothetical protein
VRVEGREITKSGTIVTQGGDNRIEIDYQDLQFVLIFANDGDELAVRAEGDGKVLTLRLEGFNNPLGSAWSAEVGTTSNGKLILSLFTHSIGEGPSIIRLVNFTISTERL